MENRMRIRVGQIDRLFWISSYVRYSADKDFKDKNRPNDPLVEIEALFKKNTSVSIGAMIFPRLRIAVNEKLSIWSYLSKTSPFVLCRLNVNLSKESEKEREV